MPTQHRLNNPTAKILRFMTEPHLRKESANCQGIVVMPAVRPFLHRQFDSGELPPKVAVGMFGSRCRSCNWQKTQTRCARCKAHVLRTISLPREKSLQVFTRKCRKPTGESSSLRGHA